MSENIDLLPQSYIELMEEVARVVNLDEARKEGIEQGVKQGQNENRLEIAKNMISENMDIEMISKITGLPKEKIESLK